MFSNLKNKFNKRYYSVIFFINGDSINMSRSKDTYKIEFASNEKMETYFVSEKKFFQYLENAMKQFSFSGKYSINEFLSLKYVTSFTVKNI